MNTATTGRDPDWRRSSHCADSACIEVAFTGDAVLMRDAKRPDGPILRFSVDDWRAFVDGVTDGGYQPRP